MRKLSPYICFGILFVCLIIFIFPAPFLRPPAALLVTNDPPEHADAILVLNTGMGIYERLMEAAALYNQGYAKQIIINGNRKNEVLKKLEEKGLEHCCPWDEERKKVLELLGVPRTAITSISAEDVYDTVSEAKKIGSILSKTDIQTLIITTSKTYTTRAIYIWRDLFGQRFKLISIAAHEDPFSIDNWWQNGKYIKQLLYEYGSWLYFFQKKLYDKQ